LDFPARGVLASINRRAGNVALFIRWCNGAAGCAQARRILSPYPSTPAHAGIPGFGHRACFVAIGPGLYWDERQIFIALHAR
jgi:hypothetical protein